MLPERTGSRFDETLQQESSLRDLIRSDESFLSMLEAIHYLNFPGY